MSWLSSLFDGATFKKHSHDVRNAITKATAAQVGADQTAANGVSAAVTSGQTALQPWQTAGASAVGSMGGLLGLNGDGAQQSAIDSLKNSPLYQSLFHNGEQAVLANAAATGGLRGGNVENSLAHFGTDTLAQTIQQQLANLGGLSGQGLTAAAGQGTIGLGGAESLANIFEQQGAHQAGGILGRQSGRMAATNNLTATIEALLGPGSKGGDATDAFLKSLFANKGGGGIQGDFNTSSSAFGSPSQPFNDSYGQA